MNAITEISFGLRRRKGDHWTPITEYEALTDRIADEHGENYGYRDASDIRALTVAEVAIVKAAKPVDFNEDVARNLDTSEWPLDRPLVLAARVQMAMEEAARRVLALDVADEMSSREQAHEWECAR